MSRVLKSSVVPVGTPLGVPSSLAPVSFVNEVDPAGFEDLVSFLVLIVVDPSVNGDLLLDVPKRGLAPTGMDDPNVPPKGFEMPSVVLGTPIENDDDV